MLANGGATGLATADDLALTARELLEELDVFVVDVHRTEAFSVRAQGIAFLTANLSLGAFTIDTAITPDEARELAARGELTGRMMPPDAPLGHIPRVDVPERFRKMVVNGAKVPAGEACGDIAPEQIVRVYLAGEFWGIAQNQGDVLVWKALIAPEG